MAESMLTPWSDWLSPSCYRVRISAGAAERLCLLPGPQQALVRAMLEDIAEIAALAAENTARTWAPSFSQRLLEVRVGKVSIRYRIDESARTLSVEHVVLPTDDDAEPDLQGVG